MRLEEVLGYIPKEELEALSVPVAYGYPTNPLK